MQRLAVTDWSVLGGSGSLLLMVSLVYDYGRIEKKMQLEEFHSGICYWLVLARLPSWVCPVRIYIHHYAPSSLGNALKTPELF